MTTFDCVWLLTESGWKSRQRVNISPDGLIESIQDADQTTADHQLNGWVVPGMANVHSHAHQRLIAGMTGWREPGQSSFWSWRQQMYRVLDELTANDLRTVAAYLYAELLEGGYTSTGEFHYAHRLNGASPMESSLALLDAANASGMALTLLPVWYCYGGFGRIPLDERQRSFTLSGDEIEELIGSLMQEVGQKRRSDYHVIGLAPHSLRAVELKDLGALLDRLPQLPVHLHIAEQTGEVESCLEHSGKRPIELLCASGLPNSDWCLIHATHCIAAELDRLAQADVVVGLCPSTEADLGDGIFPAAEWQLRGGRLAIGSDSNVMTSAPGELRQLEWSQRLTLQQRNVLIESGASHLGTSLWCQASKGGARALRQTAGLLTIGCRADLVQLRADHPMLQGLSPDQALDSFVMSNQCDMIDSVWVAGRCKVRGGRHLDHESLSEAFADLRGRLMASVQT